MDLIRRAMHVSTSMERQSVPLSLSASSFSQTQTFDQLLPARRAPQSCIHTGWDGAGEATPPSVLDLGISARPQLPLLCGLH